MNKDIILICSDVNEATTDTVCRWLSYYKKPFLRISELNVIKIKSIVIDNHNVDICFTIDNIDYCLSDFKSYWYRRSKPIFDYIESFKLIIEGNDISEKINSYLFEEYQKIIDFFKYELNKKASLNKFEDNHINKLTVLSMAQEIDIKISKTLIVNDLSLVDFENERYITKAISDLILIDKDKDYFAMTERVTKEDCSILMNSLLQEEVNKEFKIRIFMFNRTFYSSVIFSQENNKTELDFRNYDFENPNVVVPFKIPNELEQKLLKLADKLDLKSGSFDIAYTTDREYVLFEINPVGQFEQVSNPCNYNLHKLIAQYL